MKNSRFITSQIVAVLKEGEAGVAVAQLTRKHRISAASGARSRISSCVSASLASSTRMPTSSASTGPIEKRFRAHTCSTRWRRCGRSPPKGSSATTKSRHTMRWEACRQRVTASVCSPRKLQLGTVYWKEGLTDNSPRRRGTTEQTPDSAVTKEFLSCESGWSKTIRRPLKLD